MSHIKLIEILGDMIKRVDVLRSQLPRANAERVRLDNVRDQLNASQLRLVRSAIKGNTKQFRGLADSLVDINAELQQTITDVKKTAETLAALVKAVGVLEKILALVP
jgi:hypothetical protein